MKLLIVEDAEKFVETLTRSLSAVEGLSCEVALSRDAATKAIENNFYDAIALDLNLPTEDHTMDLSISHGHAVFGVATAHCPQTPILFLTGSSPELLYSELLRSTEKVDLWGDQKPEPTIALFAKLDVPEFVKLIEGYARRIAATDAIEIITGGVELNLSLEDSRAIRVFCRRTDGEGIRLMPISGGLSGSRVLKAVVLDGQGKTKQRAIAKLDTRGRVDHEQKNSIFLTRLMPEYYAPLIATVSGGLRGRAAVFYRLADGFDEDMFDLAALDPSKAVALVKRLQTAFQPWSASSKVSRLTVEEIVEHHIDLKRANELATAIGLDFASLARREIRTSLACCHGDLHGANVLVRNRADPLVIDYGDVGEKPVVIDPITLELSNFSHPKGIDQMRGWRPREGAPWQNAEAFFEGAPCAAYLHAIRDWTRASQYGDQDVRANVLGYSIRQLKYASADKELFTGIAKEMVRALTAA